jgi:hypothetical protein
MASRVARGGVVSGRLTRGTRAEVEALISAYPRELRAVANRVIDPLLGTVAVLADGGALLWRWPPGVSVRMTADLKAELRGNGSAEHVEEFGDCSGVVLGPTDYGQGRRGPELDVRWQPSGLRYAYAPEHLEVV